MPKIPTEIKDNAFAQLQSAVLSTSKIFNLVSGEGVRFPQPTGGAATSDGDAVTLNSTDIQSSGVIVGDIIINVTKSDPVANNWCIGVVTEVLEDLIKTTRLAGGSTQSWDNEDAWVVKPFVVNFSKRTGGVITGAKTQFEKVLITSRDGDSLSCPAVSGYRGFDGTSVGNYGGSDFVTIEVDTSFGTAIKDLVKQIYLRYPETVDVILKSIGGAKGSIISFSGESVPVELPVGGDGQVLKADASNPAGVSWGTTSSGGTVTRVAGEAISANDPVFVNSDGEFLISAISAQTGSDTSLKTLSANYAKNAKVSDGKIVSVYSDSSNIYARAYTLASDGTRTLGAEVTILSSTSHYGVQLVSLGEDAALVCWNDGGVAKFSHLSLSDLVITASAVQNGTGGFGTSTSFPFTMCKITDSMVVVCGHDSGADMRFFVATISGAVVSSNATVRPFTNNNSRGSIDCCRLDDQHVLVQHVRSGSIYIYAYDLLNPASPALDASISVGFAGNGAMLIPIGENKFITANTSNGKAYSFTGSSFTSLDSNTDDSGLSGSDAASHFDAINLSEGKAYSVHDSGVFEWILNLDNSVSRNSFATSATIDDTGSVAPIGSNKVEITSVDASNNPTSSLWSIDTSEKAQFIASQTVAQGASLDAVGTGGELTTEAGLIAGEPYQNGVFVWGVATSDTSAFITRDPNNN